MAVDIITDARLLGAMKLDELLLRDAAASAALGAFLTVRRARARAFAETSPHPPTPPPNRLTRPCGCSARAPRSSAAARRCARS